MNEMISSKKTTRQFRIAAIACAALIASCAVVILAGCTDPPTSHELNNPHDPMAKAYTPVPPTDAALTLVSETRRVLVWKDSSRFESHYLIERKLGANGVFEPIGMMPQNSTSFTDSTIIRTDTTYYYRITAMGEGEKKGGLATLSAMLPFPPPASLSLQASLSGSSMVLRWNDNSSFEQGFLLERREDGAPYAERARTGQNQPAFTDAGLDSLKEYRYRVKAFTSNNESNYSNEFTAAYFPADLKEISRSYLYGFFQIVEPSTDGQYLLLGGLAVTGPRPDTVDIVIANVAKRTTVNANHGKHLSCITMSRDDRYVASFADDSTIRIWNANDLSAVKSFHFAPSVSRAAYSGDGSMLLCACTDNVIRCLSADDGHRLYELPARSRSIMALAVSPDGASFACASGGQVEVFNVADGSLRCQMPALPATVTKLKYASNNTLGAFSGGTRIDLWNGATGEPIQTITGILAADNAFTITDDGNFVMTCAPLSVPSTAGITVWKVSDKRPVSVGTTLKMSPTGILFTMPGQNRVGAFDAFGGGALTVYSFSYQWGELK